MAQIDRAKVLNTRKGGTNVIAFPQLVPKVLTLQVRPLLGARLDYHVSGDFSFELEILNTSSLLDLHYAIQNAVDFNDDHLFMFFAGRNIRNKRVEYVESDELCCDDLWAANDQIFLSDVYPLPSGCQLYYYFDFGDSWIFRITKNRKTVKYDPMTEYPREINRNGTAPEQYPCFFE